MPRPLRHPSLPKLFILGLPQGLCPLRVCGDHMMSSSVVRDLRIHLDSDVRMRSEVSRVASIFCGSYAPSVAQCLVQFSSRSSPTKLDFGKAALVSIPAFQLDSLQLQAVTNAVVRLVFQSRRYDHITPLLRRLH